MAIRHNVRDKFPRNGENFHAPPEDRTSVPWIKYPMLSVLGFTGIYKEYKVQAILSLCMILSY